MLLYYTVTPKLCSWNLRFTNHEADYKKCKTVPTKFIRVQNSFAYLFYVSFFSAIEFNSQSHSLVLRVLLSMKWIEVNHISKKHDFYIVCDTCMISQCLTSYHNTFIVNIEPTCMYLLWHRRQSSIWRHRIGIVSVSTSWQHCTHFPVYFVYIIYIAKMLSEDMKSISTLSSVLS